MIETNRTCYLHGMRDGIPIALGYLAVGFTLGIAARTAGFSALQAGLMSGLTNASAGGFVGITLYAAGAGILELIIMEIIANARYLLMSCALSQKLSPDTSLLHRLILSFDVTDEIFGISIAVPGKLNPWYAYGAFTVAIPGWAGGTALGVLMGEVLPAAVVRALGVGLYGMFLAIIIPPARKSRVLAGVVAVSMLASLAFTHLPVVSALSAGTRTILLTVLIAGGAAVLFPVQEKSQPQTEEVPPEEEMRHAA
jgi:predicted branched-subunit amino acid permease